MERNLPQVASDPSSLQSPAGQHYLSTYSNAPVNRKETAYCHRLSFTAQHTTRLRIVDELLLPSPSSFVPAQSQLDERPYDRRDVGPGHCSNRCSLTPVHALIPRLKYVIRRKQCPYLSVCRFVRLGSLRQRFSYLAWTWHILGDFLLALACSLRATLLSTICLNFTFQSGCFSFLVIFSRPRRLSC